MKQIYQQFQKKLIRVFFTILLIMKHRLCTWILDKHPNFIGTKYHYLNLTHTNYNESHILYIQYHATWYCAHLLHGNILIHFSHILYPNVILSYQLFTVKSSYCSLANSKNLTFSETSRFFWPLPFKKNKWIIGLLSIKTPHRPPMNLHQPWENIWYQPPLISTFYNYELGNRNFCVTTRKLSRNYNYSGLLF